MLANKYRVERILGRGGMGYVVEAKHVALDERVALKFLLPEYAQHPEAATRFLREARAAVKIKSEHVARVSDVGTLENGAPYMVMEFLNGSDLAQLLASRGVFSIEDAIDYILQACEAIAEAHAHGIVHRDLKPANLFLAKRIDGTPLVKVLDFGISKMTGAGDHALTRTSTAMGSALYMSPEQMQETRGVDHRTDIYSLGIALFELLAGKQPFYAETLPQLCAEVLTGTPKPLSFFRSDVPPELAARLEHAYERDKTRRYQSIGELVVALAPWAPARSQGTIDRIARMSGLTAPAAGSAYAAALGTTPARATMPSAPEPITSPTALAPAPARPMAGSEPTIAAPSPAPKTALLPAVPAELPIAAPALTNHSPLGVAMPSDSDTSRIEADAYNGPRSAHAAAAFAIAAKKPPPGSGRAFLVVALALGALVGIGGGVLVFALRSNGEAIPEPNTKSTTPAAALPSPAPLPASSPSSAAPEDNGSTAAPTTSAALAPSAGVKAGTKSAPSASTKSPAPTKKHETIWDNR